MEELERELASVVGTAGESSRPRAEAAPAPHVCFQGVGGVRAELDVIVERLRGQRLEVHNNNNACSEPESVSGALCPQVATARDCVRVMSLLVATTTRGTTVSDLPQLPLFARLLPSVAATALPLPKGVVMRLYIGYDYGDPFYDNASRLSKLRAVVDSKFPDLFERVRVLGFENCQPGPVAVWNKLARRAYDEGAHYLYQLGDDVLHLTPGWLPSFVSAIDSADCVAAAPQDDNEPHWATQICVGRAHVECFGFLFDPAFPNYLCDSWIQFCYLAAGRLRWLREKRVRNESRPPRYSPSRPLARFWHRVFSGVSRLCARAGVAEPEINTKLFEKLCRESALPRGIVSQLAPHFEAAHEYAFARQIRLGGVPNDKNARQLRYYQFDVIPYCPFNNLFQ